MVKPTDLDLIERTLAGEYHAFSILVERYQAGIRRQVAAHTPPWVDRDSITQETFLIAYKKLGLLRSREQFQAWLYRIATNRAHTWVRRQLKQTEFTNISVEHHEEQDPLPATLPHDPVIIARLRSAFAQCSAVQRDVLLHHYVRGLSYRQTGLLLKCHPNAVRSRLQKARRRLRKELNKMTTKKDRENVLQLDQKMLADFRTVARAQGKDPSHPVKALQGILLDKKGKLVATDGRHMVIRHCPEVMQLSENAVIAGCDAEDFPNVEKATLIVGLTEAILSADGHDDRHFSLREEPYPNYWDAIPNKWQYKIRLSKHVLNRGITEIQPYLSVRHPSKKGYDYTPLVDLLLNAADQELVLRVSEQLGYNPREQGKINSEPTTPLWEHRAVLCGATAIIDGADNYLQTCLNYEYLLNAVSGLGENDQSEIEALFVAAEQPVMFRSCNQPNHLGAVMPVRLS